MVQGRRPLEKPPLVQRLESRVLLAGAPPHALLVTSPEPLRINAGGGAYTDSVGRAFEADNGFTGGRAVPGIPGDVQRTADDPLFYSYRAGTDFSFSKAAADGNYALWLEFAEPESSTGAAGQRVFDVRAEGRLVLDDLDVAAAAGGAGRAVVRAFDVTVTGGSLDLSFHGVLGEAIVSAVVLVPTDAPPEAAAYGWPAMTEEARRLVTSNNLRKIGLAVMSYASEQVRTGSFPPDLPTLAAYARDMLPYQTLGNPRTSTAVPRGELTPLEQVAWVAGRRDYLYLGAGRTSGRMGPEDPLAYENPDRVAGDIFVLFGDAHVEVLGRAEAAALLGFPPGEPSDPPPPRPTPPAPDPDVSHSALNLRQVSFAVNDYVYTRHLSFPADLGVAYASYGSRVEASSFVNPRTDDTPPPDDWTTEQKAAWIRASTGYLYLAGGKRSYEVDPDDLVVYENPAGMTGGINLLFGDGRVEFRETRWAQETLAAQDVRLLVRDGSLRLSPGPQAVVLEFTRGVGSTLAAGDVVVTDLATNQAVPETAIALGYHPDSPGPVITFPGYANGVLPDGNYRLVLPARSVSDAAGRTMAHDYVLNFFVLAGDVNRDRAVNGTDFALLAANFGRGGRTYGQGDLNGDGLVNGSDFSVLAGNFGKVMPGPAAAPVVALAPAPPVAARAANPSDPRPRRRIPGKRAAVHPRQATLVRRAPVAEAGRTVQVTPRRLG